jgi:hypothetical protein
MRHCHTARRGANSDSALLSPSLPPLAAATTGKARMIEPCMLVAHQPASEGEAKAVCQPFGRGSHVQERLYRRAHELGGRKAPAEIVVQCCRPCVVADLRNDVAMSGDDASSRSA